MGVESRFERYAEVIAEALGHADRATPARWYLRGLMLPGQRKSVEPMAARVHPQEVRSAHQSMHHLVADSEWSDTALLEAVARVVVPVLSEAGQARLYWIVDDTGFRKYGKHSVGVARQYCGQLGKTDNCQVAVSLSLATHEGSFPLGYRLYLPREWAEDEKRCDRAGVPPEIGFMTKGELAWEQIEAALTAGIPRGTVLMDAGYGDEAALRDRLSAYGLIYAVGIRPQTAVWWDAHQPAPAPLTSGQGRPRTRVRRDPSHRPIGMLACRLRVIVRSRGVKALTHPCARALHAYGCVPRKAIAPARKNGCSSNGRKVRPSLPIIGSLPCRPTSRSRISWPPSKCAGASSATTASSNKNWASGITKGAIGAAFIIMRACVSQPMASSCWNGFQGSKKTPLDSKRLPYPQGSARAGLAPMQRHIPWSIATVRFRLARAIARRLPQCPCCGKQYARADRR